MTGGALRVRDQPVDHLLDRPVDEDELVHVGTAVLPQPLLELELVRQVRIPQHPALAVEQVWMMRRHEMREDELRSRLAREALQVLEIAQVAGGEVHGSARAERAQPGDFGDREQVFVAKQAAAAGNEVIRIGVAAGSAPGRLQVHEAVAARPQKCRRAVVAQEPVELLAVSAIRVERRAEERSAGNPCSRSMPARETSRCSSPRSRRRPGSRAVRGPG